jgi:hypothetical protein
MRGMVWQQPLTYLARKVEGHLFLSQSEYYLPLRLPVHGKLEDQCLYSKYSIFLKYDYEHYYVWARGGALSRVSSSSMFVNETGQSPGPPLDICT